MELKTTLEIPAPYRQLFERYERFNEVQSLLLDDVLRTDKSVVLRAPTGSGKTVAFELAVVRMLHAYDVSQMELEMAEQQAISAPSSPLPPPKAVYVAPMKALCSEKFLDWHRRFDGCQLQVLQITGDSEIGELLPLIDAKGPQLVVTTPEKWHSLTRRWHECEQALRSVRLLMLDEVHLLNDAARGPILEALVARTKALVKAVAIAGGTGAELRLLVASATIPNTEDLAAWLGEGNAANVAQLIFSDAQRPVPLERHVIGYDSKLTGFQFDMSLRYKLGEVLRKYAERKATLIFCNSRKSTEMAAATMSSQCNGIFPQNQEQRMQLEQLATQLHDLKLRKLVLTGVAYHHAGLDYSDRGLIEAAFRDGALMVLLATNTLAIGVNLPAHLVVVKSTETYAHGGGLQEYSEATVLQMIGRAGRPQYDVKGVAVIMTHSRHVRHYENLMSGQAPVESHLHKHLAEHLNSEVVLNTINSLEAAMHWLRSTYLYVRALRNPLAYGLQGNVSREFVEHKLEEMCLQQIDALQTAGLLVRQQRPCGIMRLAATNLGRLMAKYCLCLDTMEVFAQLSGNASLWQVLSLLVRCREFEEFTIRVSEKSALNALNATPIRFPIRGRIKQREQKISCLIQATFSNLQISSPGLAQEAVRLLRIGERLANCLLEYMHLRYTQTPTTLPMTTTPPPMDAGIHRALLHAATIAKCFHARLWENSEFASKQLRKIGAVYAGLLADAGKSTLQSIAETDARTIEMLLKRPRPFGDELLQNLLQTCPRYDVQLSRATTTTTTTTTTTMDSLQIRVTQLNALYVPKGLNVLLIVGDSTNNLLLYVANVEHLLMEEGNFERTAKIADLTVEYVVAHVIHPTLVGVDAEAKLVLNAPLPVSPSKKAPPKRKRQTKLNFLAGGSKRKRSKQQNNVSQLNTALLVDDDDSDEALPAAGSALAEDSFIRSLDEFCFNKQKLVAQQAGAALVAPRNDAVCGTAPVSGVHSTTKRSGQTKLTDFFGERKIVATAATVAANKIIADCNLAALETPSSFENFKQFNVGLEEENANSMTNATGTAAKEPTAAPAIIIDLAIDEAASARRHHVCAPKEYPAFSLAELHKSFHLFDEAMLSYTSHYLSASHSNAKPDVENVAKHTNLMTFDLTADSQTLNISIAESEVSAENLKPNMSHHTAAATEHSCASDETLRFWYAISLKFERLQAKQRNFENFKRVYECIRSAKSLQAAPAALHGDSALNDTLDSNRSSNAASFKCPSNRPTQRRSLMPAPPRAGNNSFRLQILEEQMTTLTTTTTTMTTTTATPADQGSCSGSESEAVNNINRSVMEHVMSQKVEQQAEEDNLKMLRGLEEELFAADSEDELGTFEDFCRLYCGTTTFNDYKAPY